MMRVMRAAAVAMLAVTAAATSAHSQNRNQSGAVELTGRGPVSQNPKLPDLNLNNTQRETIRRAVLTQHTDAEFRLKSTKPDKDFTPSLGVKLPKGLAAVSLPQPLVRTMPKLDYYKYLTVKDKVLIVNPMSNTVVDMFSETQPVT
jgi:hypothetical protein